MPFIPGRLKSDLEELADALRAECRHLNGAPTNDDTGRPVGCGTCADQAHTLDMAFVVVYDITDDLERQES